MIISKSKICVLVLGLASVVFCLNNCVGEDYKQAAGLIDLRTKYSDGAHDLNFLIGLAKERGFDAIFINNHDRVAMEYGVFPFRNIFRKREELSSINKRGADKHFQYLQEEDQKHPEIIIVPGSETAPFYYWTGNPLKGSLTANNWERHLLVMGLSNPEDYKNLPILHNGFSMQYFKQLLPVCIVFIVLICLSIILIFRKGYYKVVGIVILINSSLFLIDNHPFKGSLFNQYSGDRGYLPYQEVIDYVKDRGGMTFWNHPEATAGMNLKKGPITAHTPPHPDALLKTKGYTGFATIYGSNIKITEPGRAWDMALLEYCRGERKTPAWGISTADFHVEGSAGEKLGNFPTVFLVKEKTKEELLSALRSGRMYACRSGENFQRFVLEDFTVSGPETAFSATMGDTIEIENKPKISIKISSSDKGNHAIDVRLIRSGKLINIFSGTTPFKINFEDDYTNPDAQIYYRLDIQGKLVSNPIFVKLNQ